MVEKLVPDVARPGLSDRAGWLSLRNWGEVLSGDSRAEELAQIILDVLRETPPSGVVALDCYGISMLDVRFARLVAEKVIRSRDQSGKRYNEGKYIVLWNCSEEVAETCDLVLRSLRDAVLAFRPGNENHQHAFILGSIPSYLREVIQLLVTRESITSKELAALLGLRESAAAERLRRLHEWGFVTRIPTIVGTRPGYTYHLLSVTRPPVV